MVLLLWMVDLSGPMPEETCWARTQVQMKLIPMVLGHEEVQRRQQLQEQHSWYWLAHPQKWMQQQQKRQLEQRQVQLMW